MSIVGEIPQDIKATAESVAMNIAQSMPSGAFRHVSIKAMKALIGEALLAERPHLQPISTAPDHERVMVAGWNNATKRVQGYWWWHEDVIVDGKAFEHLEATHWFPIVMPAFPIAPEGGAE